MATQTASPVVRLSKQRIEALIDREAKRRLGITGQQFRRRLKARKLPKESVAVRDIAMLVKLVSANNSGAGHPRLR